MSNFLQSPLLFTDSTNTQRVFNSFVSYLGPKYYTTTPTNLAFPNQPVLKDKPSMVYTRPLINLNSTPPVYSSSNPNITRSFGIEQSSQIHKPY
jgi:hypothetical protein